MDIKSLTKLEDGTRVEIRVMLADKKILQKKNKEDFLSLDVQDATGKMNFPVWTDVELLCDAFEVGQIIDIDALVGFWDGLPQFRNPRFHVLTEEEIKDTDMNDFVPSYKIPDELIKSFEDIVDNMKQPYKDIAMHATGALGCNEERWRAFTTCVSARKHHGNKRGGLFLHTYGVLKVIDNTIRDYVEEPYFYDAKDHIDPDRMRLKAIFHDIKKVDEYEYETAIKSKPDKRLGHIYDGIVFLHEINKETGNKLSPEQVEDISCSILSHHGQWGPQQPETLEEWILHLADMIDSKVVGCVEK